MTFKDYLDLMLKSRNNALSIMQLSFEVLSLTFTGINMKTDFKTVNLCVNW